LIQYRLEYLLFKLVAEGQQHLEMNLFNCCSIHWQGRMTQVQKAAGSGSNRFASVDEEGALHQGQGGTETEGSPAVSVPPCP
jgi:hypothetical protein